MEYFAGCLWDYFVFALFIVYSEFLWLQSKKPIILLFLVGRKEVLLQSLY